MGSLQTNLSLTLAGSVRMLGNPSKKHEGEGSNLLDLNLSPEEQSEMKLRLSCEQSSFLEDNFKMNRNLDLERTKSLASQLNLAPREIEFWFQKRRARPELKLLETDSEQWQRKTKEEMAEEIERLKQELEMANFQASKRAKLDGAFSQLPVTRDANGHFFCPNCHHNLSTVKDYMSRPAILKPTPKYGGIPKVPRR